MSKGKAPGFVVPGAQEASGGDSFDTSLNDAADIYAERAAEYRRRGWWPIPVSGKSLPATGATGRDGVVSDEKVASWTRTHAGHNIAIRHDGTVGIDVDVYDDKHGDKTLAALEARWGTLPPTWSSTARGKDSPSRQYVYRVVPGTVLVGEAGDDIEVIQHDHRYMVAWPSTHPKTGLTYRWYGPDGDELDGPPHVDDLPDLPDAWLAGLTAGRQAPRQGFSKGEKAWRKKYGKGQPSPAMLAVLEEFAAHGYPQMLKLTGRVIGLAKIGETGAAKTLDAMRERWVSVEHTSGDVREFDVAVEDAIVRFGKREEMVTIKNPKPKEAEPEAPRRERKVASLAESLMSVPDLGDLPEPRPLIDRTIMRGSVCLIAGYWGTAKSFIALSIAASVATGRSWHERRVPSARKVLYIAAEGVFGLHKRMQAWQEHEGRTVMPGDLHFLPRAVQLGDRAQVDELIGLIRANHYGLVVFDTLSKCIVGVEENSASDMSRIVSALYDVQEATGDGTVLAIHHTGKDKLTVRGSSAVEAGVDVVYVAEESNGLFRFKRTKFKDGPLDDELSFELVPVQGTDSVALSVRWGADMTEKAGELMSVMSANFSHTGASKADLRAASGMVPATFYRSVNTLVERGLLRNTSTTKTPFYVMQTESEVE